ncbi:hypothetical protein [Streptomyces sp. NPDC017448]
MGTMFCRHTHTGIPLDDRVGIDMEGAAPGLRLSGVVVIMWL